MATVSRGTKVEKFRFILRNRHLGIKALCRGLRVSRSGYYVWLKRTPSKRDREDRLLLKKIRQIYIEHHCVYGSPRMHRTLQERNIKVGKKRVERLMREHGIQGRAFTVTYRHTGQKKFMASGENLLRKASKATGPNQHWAADVTYLKVDGKWHYLAVILDIYSRRIVGWSLGKNRTVELTSTVLRNAIKSRRPEDGLIFHTDRGIEFINFRFREILQKHGIKASLNRPGRCTDNAYVESFFHTLKTELIRGNKFNNELELRLSLKSYINKFYNHKRIHSGISYNSPAEFERQKGFEKCVHFIGGTPLAEARR